MKHRTAPACVDRGGEEVEAAKPPAGESCTLRIFVGVEDSEDGQLAVRREFPSGPEDDEAVRRRRSSTNRVLTMLKAALNRAFKDGKVSSDFSNSNDLAPMGCLSELLWGVFGGVNVAERWRTPASVRPYLNQL